MIKTTKSKNARTILPCIAASLTIRADFLNQLPFHVYILVHPIKSILKMQWITL